MNLDKTPYKSGLIEFLEKYSHGTQLVIPVYQRNYTWTVAGQINPFLEDIEKVMEGRFKTHFMGIVIYNVTKFSSLSGNEYSIIDGQQRITTTVLLLYAIRDYLFSANKIDAANKIENKYLINENISEEMKLKLKPLVSDDNALQKIVNKESFIDGDADKKSNVYLNYKRISQWLRDVIQVYDIDDVLNAIDQLYIVAVPVDNNDYPQKIFESINSKGVSLNSSDLIRNYIFMGLENKSQETYYDKYWKKIEDNVGNSSKKIEEFFRFYITSMTYNLPRANNNGIYHSFRMMLEDKYEDHLNDIDNIIETLENILAYSKYYNYIYIKELSTKKDKLNIALKEFRKIDSKMPAPLLMKMYHYNSTDNEYGMQKISDDALGEIINITINYLMRRALADLDTSDVTRLFAPITKNVVDEAKKLGFDNILEIYKKHLINKNQGKGAYCPDNLALKEAILGKKNMYILKATRIALDKAELFNNPAPVDLSALSVEHLMPQTHTSDWLAYLNCSIDEYYDYLNRLGNLTLATKPDNSKMSNNPFSYKKEILASTSHLTLNKKILSEEDWTFRQIEKRTAELADLFNTLYPYQTASAAILNKKSIYIDAEGVIAEGIYEEDTASVQILPGSMVKKMDKPYITESQNIRLQDLLDDQILEDNESCYIFKKDYTFYAQGNATALSSSAGFILHGSRNGWDYWKTVDGVPLCKYYKQQYEQNINSQQDVIDKFWNRINDLIDSYGNKYFKREDYHKKYFDFCVDMPFHGFIDFWDINKNVMQFGIYFNNKNNGFDKVSPYLDDLNSTHFKYEIKYEGSSALIGVKHEIPDITNEAKFNEMTELIYQSVDALLDKAIEIYKKY